MAYVKLNKRSADPCPRHSFAIERDEAAVLAWKRKSWPALKKSVPPSAD